MGRILVAEDEIMLRIIAVEMLEDAGFTVFQAADGEEALAMLKANPDIDLLVSDVKMPRMDGYALVQAGRDFGVKVMGDNLAAPDMVAAAKRLEDLGCDYIIHHIGFDERRGIAARGEKAPNPLDQLQEIVQAVSVPVQAVGGLTTEQAIRTPEYGAPLVVLGAPLTIEADTFKAAGGDIESKLRLICEKVHAYGNVGPG